MNTTQRATIRKEMRAEGPSWTLYATDSPQFDFDIYVMFNDQTAAPEAVQSWAQQLLLIAVGVAVRGWEKDPDEDEWTAILDELQPPP